MNQINTDNLSEDNNEVDANTATDNDTGQIQLFLGSVQSLLGLLNAHLAQTNATAEASTISIMQELIEVKGHVEAQSTRLIETMGGVTERAQTVAGTARTLIDANRKQLREIGNFQQARAEKMDAQKTSIEQVITKAAELKPLAGVLRNVTFQTKVLSLNASLEAARAGDAGNGFAVVATEVRRLSNEVEEISNMIQDKIEQVLKSIREQLEAMLLYNNQANNTEWITRMADSMVALSDNFQTTITDLEKLSKFTRGTIDAIRGDVLNVLESAQSQDITRQQIEQVQRGLTDCSDRIASTIETLGDHIDSQPLELVPLDDITESLSGGYTMDIQRETHYTELNGEDAGDKIGENDRPAIELF